MVHAIRSPFKICKEGVAEITSQTRCVLDDG